MTIVVVNIVIIIFYRKPHTSGGGKCVAWVFIYPRQLMKKGELISLQNEQGYRRRPSADSLGLIQPSFLNGAGAFRVGKDPAAC